MLFAAQRKRSYWCGFGNEWYAPRDVRARLKQAGGKTAELVFKSNGEVLNNDYDIKNGNNPYYQWGRKDPMLPSNGLGDTDKTCFTTEDQYKFKYGSEGLNTTDIKEYIRNPHKFNINTDMDGVYYNLWSTDNDTFDANDDKVIKSVYDPSPVGYSLPAPNAFTGFTTTGWNVGDWPNPLTPEQLAQFNVKFPFDKGWYFYTKPNKQGNIFWFPACGSRSFITGSLNVVTAHGYCWLAGPHDRSRGRVLAFHSGYVFPLHGSFRSHGFAVRSAEEKVLKCGLQKLQMIHRLVYTVFPCNSLQHKKRLTL